MSLYEALADKFDGEEIARAANEYGLDFSEDEQLMDDAYQNAVKALGIVEGYLTVSTESLELGLWIDLDEYERKTNDRWLLTAFIDAVDELRKENENE